VRSRHRTLAEAWIVYSEDQAVRAKGTAVRVQEPSWLDAGGAAVDFDWVESVQRPKELMDRNDRPRSGAQGPEA
jgi:hypothetical protein